MLDLDAELGEALEDLEGRFERGNFFYQVIYLISLRIFPFIYILDNWVHLSLATSSEHFLLIC